MSSIATVTVSQNRLELGAARTGEFIFTVTNATASSLNYGVRVVADAPARESWFTVSGQGERSLASNASEQVTVLVEVPDDVEPGEYTFHPVIFQAEDPGVNFTEGPRVAIDVPQVAARQSAFPWWIIVVGLLVLLLGGALLWWLAGRGDDPAPPPAEPAEPVEPAEPPAPAVREDCIDFDPAATSVKRVGGRWKIMEGASHAMFDFAGNEGEARQAHRVIRHYGADQSCFVGRPGPSLTYLLVSGKAPSGAMSGEDCLPFDPDAIEVSFVGDRWKIVQGSRWLFDFGARQSEARDALAIIEKHDFRYSCYVGRPQPSFQYLRR